MSRLLTFAWREVALSRREGSFPYLLVLVLVVVEVVAGLILWQFNLTALWFIVTAGVFAGYALLWMYIHRGRGA